LQVNWGDLWQLVLFFNVVARDEGRTPFNMESAPSASTNSASDAISLAREYQLACSKNIYMFNMLCDFIDWLQAKQLT
jgi:hypothetical protein